LPEFFALRIGIAAFAALPTGTVFVDQEYVIARFLKHFSQAFAFGGLVVALDFLLPVPESDNYTTCFNLPMKFHFELLEEPHVGLLVSAVLS
tara:strand:+ start:254 stop:529 length:276 start_codon:yes stop_codon:yes gene_type:complete